jgi:AraC-like DNA-binding protein
MGLYAVVLSIGAGNGAILAGALTRAGGSRPANRLLAALIVAVVLRVSIYILGYAGAFDRWRWLTFCPLDWSLAFGPLFWAYTRALTTRHVPERLAWHLAPAALQALYQLACFAMPLDAKWNLYTGADRWLIGPILQGTMLVQQSVYIAVAAKGLRPLAGRPWLAGLLALFAAQWLVSVGFTVWAWWVRPLSYFERFPIMAGYCLWVYALGLLGWRYGAAVAEPVKSPGRTPQDYGQLACAWRDRINAAGWWAEEGLSLAVVAGRLNVSERTLSRGLAEGLGESFTGLINRLRVDEVIRHIEAGRSDDFLTLALAAGFSSKASFNRAFRAQTGLTPSAYRDQAGRNAARQTG